jgi:protease IV
LSTFKRGARADLHSLARPLEDSERAVIESEIDAFYSTFLGVVARGRKRSVEDIEKLAQGRVYSGTDAHAQGLVDELGGLDLALERATEMAGGSRLEPVIIDPPRFTIAPPPPQPVPQAVQLVLSALGLERLVGERLVLGLNLGQKERILAYEPFGSDGRTWFDRM